MNCRSTSTFPVNGEAIALAQRHNKISTFFRSPLENGESSGYCKGIGHENPQEKADAADKGEFSVKNILHTRSILGEWCRSNPGVSFSTFSTHSPFFCALRSARKDTGKSFEKEGAK